MGALALIGALLMMPSVVTAQDDPLRTARDLYASAAYEEALAELSRVESSPETPATMRDKDAYRVFCLVALGRAVEAQERAESLVRSNPLLSVDQFPDASPRIATIFTGVQRRVLPPLVKEAYRTARARALENASDAHARLLDVRKLLAMAERVGAFDETLADIRMLVDGFLELASAGEPQNRPSATTAATMPSDAASPPAATAPSNATSPPAATAPSNAASPPAATAPSNATSPPAAVVPAAADTGITAPIAVYQPQPNVPPVLLDLVRRLNRPAAINVVINERGAVDDVIVTQSVTAAYDALIVAAARTWRYKPAMKGGVPIRFVSPVVINVSAK